MADDIEIKEIFSIEQNVRLGRTLITFHKDNLPLGSLLIEPEDLPLMIEGIITLTKTWNDRFRKQEEKRRSIKQNERKSKRDDF